MSTILSTTPMPSVDGHVDASFDDRAGWSESLGAEILGVLAGDDHCGPFIVLSYMEPMDEMMPLGFAHAHASDNWRISVRGTTNMGRDAYEQGQFRFHDGGVPYASDNFAWGPDGGYGIVMFADRRGFAIRPGEGRDRRDRGAGAGGGRRRSSGSTCRTRVPVPPPSPPRWARPSGRTSTVASTPPAEWDEIAPGVRMAAGLAGEPTGGPVLVFLDCAAGREAVPVRSIGSDTIVVPVTGSIDAAGTTLAQGDVRVEEADIEHPALVAGPDGVQLVVIFADRRALQAALDAGTMVGALGDSLRTVLPELQASLPLAGSAA